MNRKKLIHVFDQRGRSLLSYEQLEAELKRKDEEIEKLRRALRALILRDALTPPDPKQPRLH